MRKAYLLDTNILSELGKKTPDTQVIDFVSGLENAWLSVITLHEIEYGLQLLPDGHKRKHLTQVMSLLLKKYAAYIVPISQDISYQAAKLRATARQHGQVLHLADALIAGTAIVGGGLTIATRNAKDFAGLPVDVENPFTAN